MIKYLLLVTLASCLQKGMSQNFQVEIPYENVRGKLVIKANVEGIDGRFIFDTGASTAITHTRFTQCPDKLITKKNITDAHGQIGEFREICMESILLEQVNFQNVDVLVLDQGNVIECLDVDGIIGANLFPRAVVRIDSRRKVIILSDDVNSFSLSPRNQLKMESNTQNLTYFEINLGNGEIDNVMFDTGSPAFYELNEPVYTRIKKQGCMKTLSVGFGALGMGVNGTEKAARKYRVKFPQFRIGMGKFQDVVTVTMKGPASRVGTKLLEYGIVTIDYPNGSFYFEPYESGNVNLSSKSWNVDITVAGDHLIAGCVWESMKEELEGGEKVVEINGKRFDKVDLCEALTTSIAKLEGEEAMVVVLDRDGKEKKILIKKE